VVGSSPARLAIGFIMSNIQNLSYHPHMVKESEGQVRPGHIPPMLEPTPVEGKPTQAKKPSVAKPRRTRGSGSLYRQQHSANWWCQYYVPGNPRPRKESTGTADYNEAEKILQQKLAEARTKGEPAPAKLTVNELVEAKLKFDRVNGLKDTKSPEGRWRLHLAPVFAKVKVRDLSSDMLERYAFKRREEGAEPASVNRELALLRNALRRAKKKDTISNVVSFPMLKEDNVRKGFLEDHKYSQLAEATAKQGLWLRTAFEIAYSFGWRKGEIFTLKVHQFEPRNDALRLFDSKNSDGRLAFVTKRLKKLLQQCCAGKDPDDFILTREGQPIVDFRRAWHEACKEAKVDDLYFHDLRRTGVRNMRRLGISESVAMKVSGHRTLSTFRRYEIVDESDLQAVAKKLDAKTKKMERDKNIGNTTTIQGGSRTAIQASKSIKMK
jgi:integrase